MTDPGRLRRWHDRRRLWAVLAAVAALLVAWGSLMPGDELPDALPWDKANHFLGYAAIAGLCGLAGLRLPLAFAAAALFGVAIEFAQIAVPGRFGGDPADILANTLGAGCAVLALHGLRRGFLR
ncbi:VanZ family protein [Halomonas organivorans]|uniref:VanZ family protein n=1 Tax=Halomonas organivorans TaxID=257772 RepID=A0A7W5BYI6_9GAMM|nr:VanZ family protein [Halomonas organivorans]MBB3141406.1 VanZ family protein [Halomonas organivorans]